MQHLQRLKERAYGGGGVEKDIIETGERVPYDPWTDAPVVETPEFSFLEKAKPKVAPKTIKQPPISLLEKQRILPSVPKPNAGISYNPTLEDWEALLNTEGAKELSAEQKRQHAAREEAEREARIAGLAGIESDHYLTEDESAWEGVESGYEGAELNKKRPQRKTPAKRNKAKRRKEAERLAKHEALMKVKAQQSKQILEIAKEVAMKEEMRQALATPLPESSDEEIDDRTLRRRKLGRHVYALSYFLPISSLTTQQYSRATVRACPAR